MKTSFACLISFSNLFHLLEYGMRKNRKEMEAQDGNESLHNQSNQVQKLIARGNEIQTLLEYFCWFTKDFLEFFLEKVSRRNENK